MPRISTYSPALLLFAAPLAAQQPGPPAGPPARPMEPPAAVVTSATGEARITPDRANIFIGVQTMATTASAASAQNARKQKAVIDTLRALGIPAELISTVEYNVYPERVYNPQKGDSAPRITGYNVSNTVRVEVRRTEQLGALIDASLAKGANGINSLQFYASNADSARHVALASGVAKARADAEAMARAAGGRLGDLLEVSSANISEPRPMMAMARSVAGAPQMDTPISAGEQILNVSVMTRWRFLSGSQ